MSNSFLHFNCFACGTASDGIPWRELVEEYGWGQTVLMVSVPGSLADRAPKTFRTCGPDCTDAVRERYNGSATVSAASERTMRGVV